MQSISKILKEQRALMQRSLLPKLDFSELKKQAMGWQKIKQLYFETSSENLRLNLYQLSKPITASMISSIGFKKIYESAVYDIEELYKDVMDIEVGNPELDFEQSDKDFLEEFIGYCKQVSSMLNTLNSPVIWDILQKIATIYTIYSAITGIAGGSYIDTPDIVPIEEKNEYDAGENLPDEKHDYEIDIENDIDNIDIDAGTRT